MSILQLMVKCTPMEWQAPLELEPLSSGSDDKGLWIDPVAFIQVLNGRALAEWAIRTAQRLQFWVLPRPRGPRAPPIYRDESVLLTSLVAAGAARAGLPVGQRGAGGPGRRRQVGRLWERGGALRPGRRAAQRHLAGAGPGVDRLRPDQVVGGWRPLRGAGRAHWTSWGANWIKSWMHPAGATIRSARGRCTQRARWTPWARWWRS
jgi:hypothetical protein